MEEKTVETILQEKWLRKNKPKYFIGTREVSKREFDKQPIEVHPKQEEKRV